MATIQIKRGQQEGVERLALAQGELAVALDTGNVYIGTTAGKVHLNPTGGTADEAVKLKTPREFSVSGDATAPAVSFDGTQNVQLALSLANMAGLTAGTYTKLTVDAKGRVTGATQITVEDLPSLPASKITGLPTKLSQLTNDSGYQTEAQVAAKVTALVDAAPETLDTLKELADALGNDPNFATTVTGQIAGKEALLKNAAAKTAPVDADSVALVDSAASGATKRLTWANVKTALKTYFDTLYNKYTHPTYTAKGTGLYKVTVDGTGHISAATAVDKADITGLGIPAQDTTYAAATASAAGLMSAADKTKLDGVSTGANKYTLPAATTSALGGVKVGGGLAIASGVLSVGDIDGGTF